MCRYFWFHCKTYSVRGYLDYWSFLSCFPGRKTGYSRAARGHSRTVTFGFDALLGLAFSHVFYSPILCASVWFSYWFISFHGNPGICPKSFISLSIAFFFLLLTWLNSSNPSSNSFLWSTFPFLLSSYRLAKSSSLHILHVPCLILSMSLPDSVILK